MSYQPITQKLIDLIKKNGWEKRFQDALDSIHKQNVVGYEDIKTLDDYYKWVDDELSWLPSEDVNGTTVYNHVCKFYLLLDQPSVLELQNPIVPHKVSDPLTPLSLWMREWVQALGLWMDQPGSLSDKTIKTFYDSPIYNMNEYKVPRGGWKTFNQMFARELKPGRRPIAAIEDQSVIVSPADSHFDGWWENREDSHVTIKGLHWSIEELLQGSPYKDRFKGGYFMHSFLNTIDYHRQHAPVGGKVVEARNIEGVTYLEVDTVDLNDGSGKKDVVTKRGFNAPDNAGYQFMQSRGLIIIDSPIGLVAVLPMGMAQVSSVIVTAEVGQTLRKGEEISYFQFGGSDIVMVFEQSSNISFTAQVGNHYRYGTKIADAYPVLGYKHKK